ncbi:hypothetical protein ACFYE9_35900 [Rhizobium leguminosarum]|uniref:Uncharacterized protein n=2 Tax=Rhizobium leguminosarum TaxID=384 RepID=A0A154IP98_RHILE|nr:hypothetical protein [Rhizobium leguminosarum]KZB01800.1 hypothetical protein A4A59_12230 [Rhizobium leguminosarum]
MDKAIFPKSQNRASHEWLETLQPCTTNQFRSHMERGATPIFLLAPESTFMTPVWVMVVELSDGSLLRTISNKEPLARRLTSVKKVYQIARNCGFQSLTIPVENQG